MRSEPLGCAIPIAALLPTVQLLDGGATAAVHVKRVDILTCVAGRQDGKQVPQTTVTHTSRNWATHLACLAGSRLARRMFKCVGDPA